VTAAAKRATVYLVCLVAAVVVAVVGVLAYQGLLPIGSHVSLEITAADAAGTTIVGVACRNKRPRPFTLYVPWPAEGLKKQESIKASPLHGLAVYCRGEGEEEYKEVFVGPDCWRLAGRPLMETSRSSVGPYCSVSLAMMLDKLDESGVKPVAIRFALRRPDGRIVARCEKELR